MKNRPKPFSAILYNNITACLFCLECQDRDSAKTQQIYVGLKETLSTCNSQNSSKDPEVITKSVPNSQPPVRTLPLVYFEPL